MAIDFENIETVKELLKDAQSAEQDNRQRVKETDLFLNKRDGQWEPEFIKSFKGQPRYTFDKCNPIVDSIAGDIQETDFGIKVRPAGGDATKDLAQTYDGIIRNIQNISNAGHIYNGAARKAVGTGLGGWEVVNDWVDGDSFEQDLLIKPIHDYSNKVWFIDGGQEQTQSDSPGVFVLGNLTPEQYDEKFPDGKKQSVGDSRTFEAYTNKPDFIVTARILYKKEVDQELVLLSDSSVRVVNDDYEKVKDELKAAGVEEVRRRKRKTVVVMSRVFDGGGWLTKAEETVFDMLPVIPVYGNFTILDGGKITYWGAIEKHIDAQRGYNYTRSREVGEVALAPRAKWWMTRKQAGNPADQQKLQSMNTNADPVQFFTPDDKNPGPPIQNGGAQVNPGLQTAIQNSLDDISSGSGTFNPDATEIRGALSQVAIQTLENRGNTSSIKYFESLEVAICQTGRVLMKAIPKVYDTRRQVRVLAEDDSFEIVTLNDQIMDEETQELVTVNDLSKGKYDVTCDVGPAFKNRQQETVKALQELSAVVPGVGELSADVQLKNIATPGVDLVAERVRRQLITSGVIPETQLTDDEKAELLAAQEAAAAQPQEPTPEDKIANAEVARVQAETADVQSKAILKDRELNLKEQDQLLKAQAGSEKLALDELKLFLQQQAQTASNQQAAIQAQQEGQRLIIENLNTQAQTLKTIREAMGVDTFVGPHVTESFIQQAEMITDQQDEIQETPETDPITNRDLQ